MLYQEKSDDVMVKVKRKRLFGDKIMEIKVNLKSPKKLSHMGKN
jgi:hypothetical protein